MKSPAHGLTILITAGPTEEAIDPVRFISNRSTGVMGFSIAQLAKKLGFKVILISGPTNLTVPKGIDFFSVENARQMRLQVLKNYSKADVVIMAAAVADYRPFYPTVSKIKKGKPVINLKLARNPDILEELGKNKKDKILVGFALETENLYKNALDKLKKKKLDIIVANELSKKSNVFGKNKTSVLIIDNKGKKRYLCEVDKKIVAAEILKRVGEIAKQRKVLQCL